MPETPVIDEDDTKPDGSRYEMVAWTVPPSDDYPEGVKYSFQYMNADNDTLLRFDNAPYHTDVTHHHRHTSDGEIEPLDYASLRDLAEQFLNEVNELYERRND